MRRSLHTVHIVVLHRTVNYMCVGIPYVINLLWNSFSETPTVFCDMLTSNDKVDVRYVCVLLLNEGIVNKCICVITQVSTNNRYEI